jgi:hypothetical protein
VKFQQHCIGMCSLIFAAAAVAQVLEGTPRAPTAAEIAEHVSGKTLEARSLDGTPFRWEYRANGTVFFAPNYRNGRTGTWDTEEGRLCTQMPGEDRRCRNVRLVGENLQIERIASGTEPAWTDLRSVAKVRASDLAGSWVVSWSLRNGRPASATLDVIGTTGLWKYYARDPAYTPSHYQSACEKAVHRAVLDLDTTPPQIRVLESESPGCGDSTLLIEEFSDGAVRGSWLVAKSKVSMRRR